MNRMISAARQSAGSGAPSGKIVAELPLGFWVNMTGNHYDDLWRQSLYKAFPIASVRRQIIHWRLDTIRRLRNRIAHHEPILTSKNSMITGFVSQPLITLPEILECLEWVSRPTASWLRSTSRYNQAVALLASVNSSGVIL
jgi:hypothetical protein